ncbi:MAG: hypothetical protein A2X59_13155 [Nitrospirae bacterium GWC2_42_7]|nr:MAG: hypothetical protein A2X59_13155 [Nitrospirae bacterium GWC2_42_7]
MIDIHCHILPAIDDGPADLETSLAMLRKAEEDGITHIVATPHYTHKEKPTIQDIADRFEMVREKIEQSGISMTLLSGADIRLSYELLDGIEKKEIPMINNSRYFLLELPDLLPPNLDNFIFNVMVKGYVPVITHPERNYSLLTSPAKIEPLRDSGALIQLTAMSLTGDFGDRIKKFSYMLMKKGFVDFIATDAHNLSKRAPVLSRAFRETADQFGKEEADRIFLHNPLAVIENREIR